LEEIEDIPDHSEDKECLEHLAVRPHSLHQRPTEHPDRIHGNVVPPAIVAHEPSVAVGTHVRVPHGPRPSLAITGIENPGKRVKNQDKRSGKSLGLITSQHKEGKEVAQSNLRQDIDKREPWLPGVNGGEQGCNANKVD
jgi:hypothetical protein